MRILNLRMTIYELLPLRRWLWLVMILAAQTACMGTPPVAEEVQKITIPMAVDQTQAVAGQPLRVELGPAEIADGTEFTLMMTHTFGVRFYDVSFHNSSATILIPGRDTIRSGYTTFTLVDNDYTGEADTIIIADAPIEPIVPLVGPDTIVANGQEWAIAAVLPYDQFLNPVNPGTEVSVRVRHPADVSRESTMQVENLVAWQRVYSATKVGRTTVTMNVENRYGPEGQFWQIPDWPQPFTLQVHPELLVADGRQLVTLSTSELRDQYDNVIPDGTAVQFNVVDTATREERRLSAFTVNGWAEVILQSPSAPQTLAVTATVYSVQSEPMLVAFAPQVQQNYPIEIQYATDDAFGFSVGPILGEMQQFVPDGSLATLLITQDGEIFTDMQAQVAEGYAHFEVRRDTLGIGRHQAQVAVGGVTQELVFDVTH